MFITWMGDFAAWVESNAISYRKADKIIALRTKFFVSFSCRLIKVNINLR